MLKADSATIVFEKGIDGKFQAKSTSFDQNKVFLPGDQVRIEMVSGQLVLTRWHSAARAKRVAETKAQPMLAGGLAAAIEGSVTS